MMPVSPLRVPRTLTTARVAKATATAVAVAVVAVATADAVVGPSVRTAN
jgi:hypothetical protein